jgi:hypothetical protein
MMATNNDGLRLVDGPGKFQGELLISEQLYWSTLDGITDEECPFGDGMGWYGLIRAGSSGGLWHGMLTREGFELTEDESDFLADRVGAILYESSDGAISVTYYETTWGLNKAWASILSACNADPEDS